MKTYFFKAEAQDQEMAGYQELRPTHYEALHGGNSTTPPGKLL